MPTKDAKGAGRSPKKKAKRSEAPEAKRPGRDRSGLLRARAEFGALVAIVAWLAIVLIARTVERGDDFQVFYRVAQRFWDGVRPYDQITYGNMVFKYPPWILPFFLPFGFLDLATAKMIWGLPASSR